MPKSKRIAQNQKPSAKAKDAKSMADIQSAKAPRNSAVNRKKRKAKTVQPKAKEGAADIQRLTAEAMDMARARVMNAEADANADKSKGKHASQRVLGQEWLQGAFHSVARFLESARFGETVQETLSSMDLTFDFMTIAQGVDVRPDVKGRTLSKPSADNEGSNGRGHVVVNIPASFGHRAQLAGVIAQALAIPEAIDPEGFKGTRAKLRKALGINVTKGKPSAKAGSIAFAIVDAIQEKHGNNPAGVIATVAKSERDQSGKRAFTLKPLDREVDQALTVRNLEPEVASVEIPRWLDGAVVIPTMDLAAFLVSEGMESKEAERIAKALVTHHISIPKSKDEKEAERQAKEAENTPTLSQRQRSYDNELQDALDFLA